MQHRPSSTASPRRARRLAATGLAALALTGAGAVLGAGPAAATNEFPASVSIGDVRLFEGTGAGYTLAAFPVTVFNNPGTIDVTWTTLDGSGNWWNPVAQAPGDYLSGSGTVTLTGDTTKYVGVRIVKDAADEANEHFRVKLTGASGFSSIDDPIGLGTIMDDDGPAPKLNVLDAKITEGTGAGHVHAIVDVVLSKPAAAGWSFTFTGADGTATQAGLDYKNPYLEWVNPAAARIRVPVRRDSLCEGTEHMSVKVSNPNGVVIADAAGVLRIENDDYFC